MNANLLRPLLMLLALIAWAPALPAQDGPAPIAEVPDELPLPAPPESAQPPAVDLGVLAQLRGARLAAMESKTDFAPAAPRQVASAEPLLNGILKDVGRKAGGRRMLEEQLFEQLRQALPGHADFVLEQATIPDSLNPPAAGWTVVYNFRLPQAGIGRATYSASLQDQRTGNVQRFSGTVAIDREASGLTVTRLVRRGETIRETDIQTLTVRLSQLPRGALDAATSAVGAVARKELRPGEWLTDQMIRQPNLLKRGQAVTLRLEHGPLKITTQGVAMQPGGLGDTIRVQNAQSKKEVHARIISKDEVQVIE